MMRPFAWLIAATATVLVASSVARGVGAASEGTAFTGTIRTVEGAALEGIAVSARGGGTTFTTTVFTDAKGEYVFPSLAEGRYSVWAQAVGFDAGRADVALGQGRRVKQNFALKTAKDYTLQLSGS